MKTLNIISIIDAPASALNGSDKTLDNNTNSSAVKVMKTIDGKTYPYVSAQSYRHHLREALSAQPGVVMSAAAQNGKIAFSDANPVDNWDDDLLGYMRAIGKKATAKKGKEIEDAEAEETSEKDIVEALTRVSPLRSGTIVSMGPVRLTEDFGTMTRHLEHQPEVPEGQKPEWSPVPHAHNFYRTLMLNPMCLVLSDIGKFNATRVSGQYNMSLEAMRRAVAEGKLTEVRKGVATLSPEARAIRAATLVRTLGIVDGGAKQNLHYTDIRPRVMIMSAINGAANPFQYVLKLEGQELKVDRAALAETLSVYAGEFQLPLGIGWVTGFQDSARAEFEEVLNASGVAYIMGHPKQISEQMAEMISRTPGLFE